MTEEKLRDLEHSEEIQADEQAVSSGDADDRENAPRVQESAPEQPAQPARKKKRRGARIRLQAAALLLVIALVFGVVVGYAVGRGATAARLKAAEDRIDELTQAMEESGRQEIDVFTDNLSAANREALADLSGMSMVTPGEENAFFTEDEFSGAEGAAESNPTLVAEYDGGKIMSDEARARYNERLAGYRFSGYTEDELSENLLSDVLRELVTERVLEQKAKELGVYALSDADAAQIAAQAQEAFDARIAACLSFVRSEGMDEAAAQEAA